MPWKHKIIFIWYIQWRRILSVNWSGEWVHLFQLMANQCSMEQSYNNTFDSRHRCCFQDMLLSLLINAHAFGVCVCARCAYASVFARVYSQYSAQLRQILMICGKLCPCIAFEAHQWPLILPRVRLYLFCTPRRSQDISHILLLLLLFFVSVHAFVSVCVWERRRWQPEIALQIDVYARSLSALNRTIYYLFALPYIAHRTFPISCTPNGGYTTRQSALKFISVSVYTTPYWTYTLQHAPSTCIKRMGAIERQSIADFNCS